MRSYAIGRGTLDAGANHALSFVDGRLTIRQSRHPADRQVGNLSLALMPCSCRGVADRDVRHVERLPLALQGEVLDYVLYLQQKAPRHSVDDPQRRMKLSGTLERLVALNPFADTDPVAWERRQRADRCLPGRD